METKGANTMTNTITAGQTFRNEAGGHVVTVTRVTENSVFFLDKDEPRRLGRKSFNVKFECPMCTRHGLEHSIDNHII